MLDVVPMVPGMDIFLRAVEEQMESRFIKKSCCWAPTDWWC